MADDPEPQEEEVKEKGEEEQEGEGGDEENGNEVTNNIEDDHSLTMPTDDGDDQFETIQQEFQEVLAELRPGQDVLSVRVPRARARVWLVALLAGRGRARVAPPGRGQRRAGAIHGTGAWWWQHAQRAARSTARPMANATRQRRHHHAGAAPRPRGPCPTPSRCWAPARP